MTPLFEATAFRIFPEDFTAHLLLGLRRFLGLDVPERRVAQTPLPTPLLDVVDCRGDVSAAPDDRVVVLELFVKRNQRRASGEVAAVARTRNVLGVVTGQFVVVGETLLARIAVEVARRWERPLRSSLRWAVLASATPTTPTPAAGVRGCVKPGAVDTRVWRRCVFFGKGGSEWVVQHTFLNGGHYNVLLVVHLLL